MTKEIAGNPHPHARRLFPNSARVGTRDVKSLNTELALHGKPQSTAEFCIPSEYFIHISVAQKKRAVIPPEGSWGN